MVVAVYRAPRSYTGEDGAEITCHGSLPVIRRILSLLARSGFREAGPGEFTQRAFLNGRMDLTRAEAVNEIVRARTDRARSLALQRLSGAIQRKIEAVRDDLLGVQAALEACLDYPEEDHGASVDTEVLDRSAASLEALAQTCARGRLYQEGVSAALAGATNSGKSSLFNQLLRQDRAIVSEVHGTTRDWLEAAIDVEGIPVRLFDTAGTRDTGDPLEREGMRRTAEVLRGADLVVWLVDGTAGSRAGRSFVDGYGEGNRGPAARGVEQDRPGRDPALSRRVHPRERPDRRGPRPAGSGDGRRPPRRHLGRRRRAAARLGAPAGSAAERRSPRSPGSARTSIGACPSTSSPSDSARRSTRSAGSRAG